MIVKKGGGGGGRGGEGTGVIQMPDLVKHVGTI